MPQTILEILALGPATTKILAAGTGLSRQTVNRELRALGDSIVTFDNVRPPLYYAVTEAFESGNKIPVAAVDHHGHTTLCGMLRPLSHGGFYLQPTSTTPNVLMGYKKDGLYDDLPYFLDDMRPQGFIGRQIARELNAQHDSFPPDPRSWNQEQVGRYLVANGDDLPGNLKVGRMALDRVKRPPQKANRDEYAELADKAVKGETHGSSAGGEQAKFTTYAKEKNAHVIVKFSPKGNGELATRWRDILVTEKIASEVFHEYNIPAAELEIFEVKERLFLESRRFDRTMEQGRSPLLSMQSIDNEFSGVGSGWLNTAKELEKMHLISSQDLHTIAVYWGFGRLINNTDMHLGNISFSINNSSFSLAPLYDMCSMGFAPNSTGEIPPFSFSAPDINDPLNFLDVPPVIIYEMAQLFWDRVGKNPMISDEFKHFSIPYSLLP